MAEETRVLQRIAGHHDPSNIVKVTFLSGSGATAVELEKDATYEVCATEDCYWRYTTDGGTVADSDDTFLPAYLMFHTRAGSTNNHFVSAYGASAGGDLIFTKKLVTGD